MPDDYAYINTRVRVMRTRLLDGRALDSALAAGSPVEVKACSPQATRGAGPEGAALEGPAPDEPEKQPAPRTAQAARAVKTEAVDVGREARRMGGPFSGGAPRGRRSRRDRASAQTLRVSSR